MIGGENYKKMETVYINNIKFITSLIPERKLKKISPPEIWEFPKGKKSIFENGIDCAKREFEEETGIKLSGDDKNHFHFINDPITETLVGDDKKTYHTILYPVQLKCSGEGIPNIVLTPILAGSSLSLTKNYISSEIAELRWFSVTECNKILPKSRISVIKYIVEKSMRA